MTNTSNLYNFTVTDIDGHDHHFDSFKDQVLLIVNVASECGLTPQYTGLQKLQESYSDQGFNVIGFPCNQFGKQEPGNDAQVKEFCTTHYGVNFPMMSKIEVNGEGRHALYAFLSGDDAKYSGEITWNFEKFLIDKNGQVLQRFSPKTEPEDPEIIAAIEKSLST